MIKGAHCEVLIISLASPKDADDHELRTRTSGAFHKKSMGPPVGWFFSSL